MTISPRRAIRVSTYASLVLLLASFGWGQSRSGTLPGFDDNPVREIFAGTPAAPKLLAGMQSYADQIRDGVERGYGVFRGGKEEKGANFAGHLIVIQWGCGSPCMRMAVVDARTGDVYYPPISFDGVGAQSFDLPLLTLPDSVPQNPVVQFRLNSGLMIIKASPSQLGHHDPYGYYFLWHMNQWMLLRRAPLSKL
jgi:hypothetical protein